MLVSVRVTFARNFLPFVETGVGEMSVHVMEVTKIEEEMLVSIRMSSRNEIFVKSVVIVIEGVMFAMHTFDESATCVPVGQLEL